MPVSRRGRALTERDGQVLRWVGEMFGARHDVLAVLLGRWYEDEDDRRPVSRWTVRTHIQRWEDLGVARQVLQQSGPWVTLTKKGYERADLSFGLWQMPVRRLAHNHAANLVRLSYEDDADRAETAPWVSERLIWQERWRAEQTWHVPDAVIPHPGAAEAIEVELSLKTPQEYADDVFGNLRSGGRPIRAVRYFVRDPQTRDRLTGRLPDPPPVPWKVRLLPAVDGCGYLWDPRPSLAYPSPNSHPVPADPWTVDWDDDLPKHPAAFNGSGSR